MYFDRKMQFVDRLGWSLPSGQQTREIDQIDNRDPTYVIWQNTDGSHGASLRIMPTSGRTLQKDIFPEEFGIDIPSNNASWEVTRFCMSPKSRRSARHILPNVLLATCEFGLEFGITNYTGVFFKTMIAVYRRLGWPPRETLVGKNQTDRYGPVGSVG